MVFEFATASLLDLLKKLNRRNAIAIVCDGWMRPISASYQNILSQQCCKCFSMIASRCYVVSRGDIVRFVMSRLNEYKNGNRAGSIVSARLLNVLALYMMKSRV